MRKHAFQFCLVALLATAAAGCSAGDAQKPESTDVVGVARSAATVSGLTLTHRAKAPGDGGHVHEECKINLALLALKPNAPTLVDGQQVRIRRPNVVGGMGACTVRDDDDVGDNEVQVVDTGHERVGLSSFSAGHTVELDTVVANPDFTFANDDAAETAHEFYEELQDPAGGSNRKIVVIAPHGGVVEKPTDRQARVDFRSVLPANSVTSWQTYGYHDDDLDNTGARDHWHITSGDIDAASFPKLDMIDTRGFQYAISFHGFKEDDIDRVYVGGADDEIFRREIAEEINDALRGDNLVRLPAGTGAEFVFPPEDDDLDGDSSRNIVNRLASPNRGVQIEQSTRIRGIGNGGTDRSATIAKAVASVYGCLIEPAASTIIGGPCKQDDSRESSTYNPVCGRYIIGATIPSNLGAPATLMGSLKLPPGLNKTLCESVEGMVSIYKQAEGRLNRVAGGRLKGVYGANGVCTVEQEDPSTSIWYMAFPPSSGSESYRITVEGRYGTTRATQQNLVAKVTYERNGEDICN